MTTYLADGITIAMLAIVVIVQAISSRSMYRSHERLTKSMQTRIDAEIELTVALRRQIAAHETLISNQAELIATLSWRIAE